MIAYKDNTNISFDDDTMDNTQALEAQLGKWRSERNKTISNKTAIFEKAQIAARGQDLSGYDMCIYNT